MTTAVPVPSSAFQPEEWQEAERCPLCGTQQWGNHEDSIHKAAHCCLWKYMSHPERVKVAERVERGMSWQEAINGETP